MYRLKVNSFVILMVVLLFWFGGCSHMTSSGTTASVSANQPAANDVYSQQIAELNQLVKEKSNSKATKKAHLKLAHLYLDHQNHNRNYQKALEHLKIYIRMDNSKVNGETLNWFASLKEIDRLSTEVKMQNRQIDKMKKKLQQSEKETSALTRTNRKLRREEISLRDKTRKLEESNLKLQKTIEMLKELDQRLEEKRRNFNSKR